MSLTQNKKKILIDNISIHTGLGYCMNIAPCYPSNMERNSIVRTIHFVELLMLSTHEKKNLIAIKVYNQIPITT